MACHQSRDIQTTAELNEYFEVSDRARNAYACAINDPSKWDLLERACNAFQRDATLSTRPL